MIKRLSSTVAKTFSVVLAGGGILNLARLAASFREEVHDAIASALAVLLSFAFSWLLWHLGSRLSPNKQLKASADMLVEHQAKMRKAAYWLAGLAITFAALLLLLFAAGSIGRSIAPVLPYALLAAAIALVRFTWFFAKARGRWR